MKIRNFQTILCVAKTKEISNLRTPDKAARDPSEVPKTFRRSSEEVPKKFRRSSEEVRDQASFGGRDD